MSGILAMLAKGGPIMVPLVACSVVAVAVARIGPQGDRRRALAASMLFGPRDERGQREPGRVDGWRGRPPQTALGPLDQLGLEGQQHAPSPTW